MRKYFILSFVLLLTTITIAQNRIININSIDKENHLFGESERFDIIKYDNLMINKGDTIYINKKNDNFNYTKDKNNIGYVIIKDIFINKNDKTSMDKVKNKSKVIIIGENKTKIFDFEKALSNKEIYIKKRF